MTKQASAPTTTRLHADHNTKLATAEQPSAPAKPQKKEKPVKVVPGIRAMKKVLSTFEGIREEALKTEGMTEELALLDFHIRLLKNRMKPFAKVTVVYEERELSKGTLHAEE